MNFTAFLNRLNTHKIFGVGVGTALGSIAVLAGQHYVDTSVIPHLGAAAAPWASLMYDGLLVPSAQAALPPAILAAGFGRPPNVPPGPVEPQSVAAAQGQKP